MFSMEHSASTRTHIVDHYELQIHTERHKIYIDVDALIKYIIMMIILACAVST